MLITKMVFKATSFGFFLFLMSLFGLLFRVNQATTVLHEESQPHRVNTKHTVSERGSINPAFNFNLLPVAGTDWLGWGVDIKLGIPENSLKIPLFTLEYNMQQTYRYPLFPTQYFIVPDYVYTRTIAQTDSSVQYFETIQEYTSYLALGLGLELQTAVSNSQNGLSNVTGPSPGTFSGSLDVNYYSRRLSETNTLVITNTLDTALWQLVLGPTSTVTPLVLEAGLTAYATSSANGDLTALGNFINRYGTHFIESVIVGGRLQMTSVTQKANSTTQDEIALLANIHFKNAFGLQEGAAEFNLTYSTTYQTFTQQSSHSLESIGGDPQLANFFSNANNGNNPLQTSGGGIFEMWQDTLINNPSPIRYRLREISWLFPDQMDLVHQAVQAYIAGQLNVF